MALAAETKRITALFDFDDTTVNKAVKEFLDQMREFPSRQLSAVLAHRS